MNPSHILPRVFRALDAATGDDRWARLGADGLRLLQRWRLGHDAMRVAMNLVLASQGAHPAAQSIRRFWTAHVPPPDWVDLQRGSFGPSRGDAGHTALRDLLEADAGSRRHALPPAALPAPGYHATALAALCALIKEEQALA